MRLVKIALAFLRQAQARLEDAKDALREKNYPYAVRLSQECVELSLKAVLRAVGIEYPKIHDVSDVFLDVKPRFPVWFQSKIDFMSESSKILVKKREPSLYGGEEAFLSPNEVINRTDAQDSVRRAIETFGLCNKLLEQLKEKLAKRIDKIREDTEETLSVSEAVEAQEEEDENYDCTA